MPFLFKRWIYPFSLFTMLSIHWLGLSEQTEEQTPDSETPVQEGGNSSESSSSYFKEYKFGTWSYYSTDPVSLDYHLAKVSEHLRHDMYWLFQHTWDVRVKKEKLRELLPFDEERTTTKDAIVKMLHEQIRLSNCHYKSAQINLVEYVDPLYLPRDIGWNFGCLFALYGNFQKELSLFNLKPTVQNHESHNAKILNIFKVSLLYFAYGLDLSDQSLAVLQHENLDGIISDSNLLSTLDSLFQKEFSVFDEAAWIKEIQKLDQQEVEHLCQFFRSFYQFFLHNKENLPDFYVTLSAHLTSIATKTLLLAKSKINDNLDAVHPWMFKLYIDLKKWEQLKLQDPYLNAPDLEALLPQVQKECLKFLPQSFSLGDIRAENEYAICEQVRKRNLLPHREGDLIKGENITDEFEFSPVAMRQAFVGILYFFDDRARFARGFQVAIKQANKGAQQIYNYLSGDIEISDLPITEDNALDYLLFVKLFDNLAELWNSHYHVDYEYFGGMHFGFIGFDQFYFPRTTFELRKHILKLCPLLKSFEALTLSVNPDKVRDEKDQITPGAWIDESEQLREECLNDLRNKAQYLSDMMEQSPLKGTIVGARGISGCGKSTFIKAHILPLIAPEGNKNSHQIDLLAKGILNPDIIKAALRKLHGGTFNTQVHSEGANAFQEMFKQFANKGNYILDKRHLTPFDIVSNLVEPAKHQQSAVWLYDFDIPIAACVSRILARPLHGDDPCPEYEVLVDGILAIRRYRAQVISLALKEESIAKYELYATCKQHLVAHKLQGETCSSQEHLQGSLCIHDLPLFEECLRQPAYQEIEEELLQVIDEHFILDAIENRYIANEQRESLEKWLGLTLKEAIQLYVQRGKSACDECLFDFGELLPFNGEEWLKDFPQLLEYVKSEHCLHIQGIDESGRGLHWELGQLERGLNPKYNPEAKIQGRNQSGIQMKMGYFIIPMDNLDLFLSDNLSPEIARELTVRNENGELIGLRFFVHPEAYAHFTPLLQAGIHFVPPANSDFMGTPTSSYHSWLIRRISASDRRPFIVKMGTPNGSADLKHLFAGDDIVKSLKYQKSLDKLSGRSDFIIFKETAGLILKGISGYPSGTIDSGIVICELPQELLKGECKILSLNALMSCERAKVENQGIAALSGEQEGFQQLPLIYELMEIAIQKNLVANPEEFLRVYFIDAYLQAIEPIVFKEGYALFPQGHTLYIVLNADNTIRGFAYRDLEGLFLKKKFLESYSWFYRYANFIKLLNVLTQSDTHFSLPLFGGPVRAANQFPSAERSLYHYLFAKLEKQMDDPSLEVLKRLSLKSEESLALLKRLDASYLKLLKNYFIIDESEILNDDGTIPCAVKGSSAEKVLFEKNRKLWERGKRGESDSN